VKRLAGALARIAQLRLALLVALAALLVAGSATLLTGVLAADPPAETQSERADRLYPAPTYATQAEADAAAETGKQDYAALTEALVRDFMASGRSLDGLRPAYVSAQVLPTESLGVRLKGGSVVRGTIGEQRVELGGYIVSELLITEAVSGGATAGDTLLLAHTGGPRPQGEGEPPVLLMYPDNPIPQRGVEYFLILREPRQSQDGKYGVLYSAWGAGRQFEVVGGVLHDRAMTDNPSELDGKSLAEARALVTAAAPPATE